VILVFLSPPKPPKTPYSDTDSNNMLTAILTPQQLARQVGGSVKCDSNSTVAGPTRLITGASSVATDSGVRFPGESSVAVGAFALVQVLNFGSLAYIADFYSELRPLHGAAPAPGNKPPVSPPPPGLLGADLEVLAHQIRRGLSLNPIMSDRR
jgi:hypothetical protein